MRAITASRARIRLAGSDRFSGISFVSCAVSPAAPRFSMRRPQLVHMISIAKLAGLRSDAIIRSRPSVRSCKQLLACVKLWK